MFSLDPRYVRVVGGDPNSKRWWVSSPSPHLHLVLVTCVPPESKFMFGSAINSSSTSTSSYNYAIRQSLFSMDRLSTLPCERGSMRSGSNICHVGVFVDLASTWKCGLRKFDSLVYLLVGQLSKFSEAQHRIRYVGVIRLLFSIIGQLLQLLSTIVHSMVKILGEDLCIHNLRLQHTCTSKKYIYVREFSK